MKARTPLILLVTGLIATVAIANTAVSISPPGTPNRIARMWPHHPDIEIGEAMRAIAVAGGTNRPVPPAVFSLLDDAAVRAPLAPEPFLAHAVRAQLDANPALAIRAFEAAERRDPRSIPAHYFLAGEYLQRRDPRVIGEIAALARVAPNGHGSAAPYLGAFATDPKNWPAVRALFASDPMVRETTLVAMAAKPSNADAILALSLPGLGAQAQPWIGTLLGTLVSTGDIGKARAVWSHYADRSSSQPLVVDSRFADAVPPPPFNWELASSTVGLAERSRQGLHVLFYGQEDGVLARQLLVLSAGAYTLRVRGSGTPDVPLHWSLRCATGTTEIARAPLAQVERSGLAFNVPATCPGQWLELSGTSADLPTQSDVTIGAVDVVRQGR